MIVQLLLRADTFKITYTVMFFRIHKALSVFVVLDGKTSKDSVPLFTLLKQILTQRSFGNYIRYMYTLK